MIANAAFLAALSVFLFAGWLAGERSEGAQSEDADTSGARPRAPS